MSVVTADFAVPDGDALLCTLCPFLCRLAPGQAGRCRVRRREGDRLVTETFVTAASHWHPVERMPLYHYHPGQREARGNGRLEAAVATLLRG